MVTGAGARGGTAVREEMDGAPEKSGGVDQGVAANCTRAWALHLVYTESTIGLNANAPSEQPKCTLASY